jgi:hypothetical protein
MILDFKQVRIPYNLPTYPPYHVGKYIEEYFYTFYIQNKNTFDNTGFTLLPIFWTTAYWYNLNLTPYIDALPKNKKFFCVAQHDDGVKEPLPSDTIVFSAGGNKGGIPIPLVCSPIQHKPTISTRDILCSFIGSNTHSVREQMFNALYSDKSFYIKPRNWTFSFTDLEQTNFIDITSRSEFALCPRGYGLQSFRFYEALQLGAIPIYVHDDVVWKPYKDELDWDEFSISIHINDIGSIKDIISSISLDKKNEMRRKGLKAYNEVFALKCLPNKILNYLQTLNKS